MIRTNTPVPAAMCLPDGWEMNPFQVLVAPRLTGQARLDYIAMCMQTMPLEMCDDARFDPDSAYWDAQLEFEYTYRRTSFFAT